MSGISYVISKKRLTDTDAFSSASAEELRVLIALTENGGKLSSIDALAEAAHVSRARCLAAITLWTEEGVIADGDPDGEPTIVEEFEERIRLGEFDETPAKEIAKTIRDEHLAEVISECARLLNQPTLPTEQIKTITHIYSDLGVGADYILMLAAHLAEQNKLTIHNLKEKSMQLSGKGIVTHAELEQYIKSQENGDFRFAEYRRVLGLYGRALGKSEREAFKKWSDEYLYSLPIVEEAYDITTQNIGKYSLSYIDTILTDWHEAGCKTVEECRVRAEAKRAEGGYVARAARSSKTEAPKPRYGDFDVADAFKRALERSYGEDGE